MAIRLLLLTILLQGSVAVAVPNASRTDKFEPGDYRVCLDHSSDMNLFEVLPGGGWDNLANKDRGNILDITYSKCKTTEDRKYLLPDFVTTVPHKVSQINTFAKLFTHWSQYRSATCSSINVDAGVTFEEASVSGSFGDDHQHVKETQTEYKSYTSQVQLRYNRYRAELQPGFPLHPSFKARLLSIASKLQSNLQDEAEFESQLLVREYGTHVITAADAGAVLVKEDSFDTSILKNSDFSASQVSATASATFFGLDKFDSSYSHSVSTKQVQAFTSRITDSKVYSHGGPVFKTSNFTPDDWLKGIDNNLVAVDRTGDPIYFYISTTSLPELAESSVYKVRKSIEDAVALYYKFNTYRGCTRPGSPNFSLAANLDDGSCNKTSTKVNFGGVFQTCNMTDLNSGNICSDDKLDQVNPLTGSYSCPSNFQPVPVTSGTVNKQWVEHKCHSCWLFFKCCNDISHTSTATYQGFWCTASTSEPGYFFGGVFTSKVNNPFTNSQNCPNFYTPLRLSTDLSVCVSDDGDMGPPSSVPLGGFFSCRTGNPLAVTSSNLSSKLSKSSQWPKQCPTGYSIHVATTDQGCEVNYCLVSQFFKSVQLKTVRRPPYIKTPIIAPPAHEFSLFDTVSNKWMKNNEAFEFIRTNIPKASNLTASQIMLSPEISGVNPALHEVLETKLNGKTVEVSDSSLYSAYLMWRTNGKSNSPMEDDGPGSSGQNVGASGSGGIIIGGIVACLLFFILIMMVVIVLKKKTRGRFITSLNEQGYTSL